MIPETLTALFGSHRRFLITSHANPDGDAIGSEIGLMRLLQRAGKEALIWNFHPTPGSYRALPGSADVHVGTEPPAGFPAVFDYVVLECPTLDRTGLEEPLARRPLLNIDHHLGNALYGVANWVDTTAPAVGVMVAALARKLDIAVDPESADCLLLALVSDTGGFRFSNATPTAFEAAATLVREGARPEQVSQWLNESQPEGAVRLLGEMLGTLTLHDGGRVAAVHVTQEMFRRAGAVAGDSEGLVDSPRTIAGVEAVAMLREIGPNHWKVSLRSRGPVDVQAVAQRRGGGGHKNAAGCKVEGELEAVKKMLVEELTLALEVFMTLDGLLLVDKEGGCTSHDVVQMVRRIFKQKRVGHCGTLDPDATGLLLVTLGQATRLTRFLIQARKVYEGTIRFGLETDTYDASGRPVAERPTEGLGTDAIDAAMATFSGTFEQRLPAYSAHKIQGVKLYEMARRGEEIPVANKTVTVDEFVRLCDLEDNRIDFRLICSSGTYARSLAHDVGTAVGTGAHLSKLRRTRIGKPGLWFDVAEALTLAEANRRNAGGIELGTAFLPLASIPLPFLTATLDPLQERRAVNGQTVILAALGGSAGEWVRMVDRVGELVAVGSVVEAIGSNGTAVLQPRIVFKAGPDVVGFPRI